MCEIEKAVCLIYLIIGSVTDIRGRYVGRALSAGSFLLCTVLKVCGGKVGECIIGIIAGIVMILIMSIFSKGIGIGDKIAFLVVFAAVGLQESIEVMFISFMICTIYSLIGMAIGKLKMKDSLPFIPFLLAGFIFVISGKMFAR